MHYLNLHLIGFLIVLATFVPISLRAQDSVLLGELPSTTDRVAAPLLIEGLGSACNPMSGSVHSLPCNPANSWWPRAGEERRFLFSGRVFLGAEYERFKTVEELMSGSPSESVIRSLFDDNQVIDAQLAASLTMRGEYFAFQFTPAHLSYASVVRNQAYPVAAFRAMRERTLMAQGVYPARPWLHLGLRTRVVEREFVEKELSLFEALADRDRALEKMQQTVVYLEPGLTVLGEGSWEPKGSLLMRNTGLANPTYDETKLSPLLDVGGSISPPLGMGRFEAGANYRISEMSREVANRFGLALFYELGVMEATLGLSKQRQDFGLMTSFWSAHVSVLFSTENYSDADSVERSRSSVRTEFSLDF